MTRAAYSYGVMTAASSVAAGVEPERILARLGTSRFRTSFRLGARDAVYARERGRKVIAAHARDLLRARAGAAHPRNDGKQIPYRGHPVFVAQHATATCCRGCIAKWHRIAPGHELTDAELDRLVAVIMVWLDRDLARDAEARR